MFLLLLLLLLLDILVFLFCLKRDREAVEGVREGFWLRLKRGKTGNLVLGMIFFG